MLVAQLADGSLLIPDQRFKSSFIENINLRAVVLKRQIEEKRGRKWQNFEFVTSLLCHSLKYSFLALFLPNIPKTAFSPSRGWRWAAA